MQNDPSEETLELSSPFPVLKGTSGTAFEFSVELKYTGKEPKYFDIFTNAPKGWIVSVQPG